MYKKRTSFLMILCTVVLAVLISACADDGGTTNNGNGGDSSYDYVCANGTKEDGKTAKQNTNKCQSCDYGFALDNGACELDLVGRWKFASGSADACNDSSCVVFMKDGAVDWSGNCSADQAPYAPSHTTTFSVETVDGNSLGVSFDIPGPQHDYTIDVGDGYLLLNPHSTSFENVNRYLCPHVSLTPIMVDGAITDSASFVTTPSHNGALYWIVYADGDEAPTAATLISNAKAGTGGVARSSANGITTTRAKIAPFTVSSLVEKTDYDLYVALETTVDGAASQVLAEKYDFTTLCSSGYWLDDTSDTCTEHGTLSGGWGVIGNGVTITCAGASINVGDSYTINGNTYVKRAKADIITTNAATSCTSDITDMSSLFANKDFNGNITHWDTSSVTNMSSMFSKTNDFVQDISNWDVSNVTNMFEMFLGRSNEGTFGSNPNVSGWDTSSVQNMESMFKENGKFTGDISGWNVSNVTDMEGMFRVAKAFNTDISSWNVGNVTRAGMKNMFRTADSFTQDISNWCVSHIGSKPVEFDVDTNNTTWPDAKKPQWNTAQGNNCDINFTVQPAVNSDNTAIALTASKVGKLYWILYDSDTSLADVAALKTAIGTDGVGAQKSDTTGVASLDDMEQEITLSTLTSGTTYYFYAGLESGSESALSNKVTITP